ncbi:methyltransferase domain-containing protein [Candidatus Dependentiae bacterium]|nr:methyltransferase domain-containing protein [Candidatus Dependentiae bacterium]
MNEQKLKEQGKSTIFSWNNDNFEYLLQSCSKDDEVLITLKYLKDKNLKILEAGCGLGRVVKYLYDLGFKNIYGIEINKAAVDFLNKSYPELNVINGNILNMTYQKESFDIVLSYGVIEHFPAGPNLPMKSIYNVLKKGGIAIITIPSFNFLRQIKYFFSFLDLRKKNFIRKIFGKKLIVKNKKRFSYFIEPQIGEFFEYRFTPLQFEKICKNSGFEIIASLPIAHVDGLFHTFGTRLVEFDNWQFKMTRFGKIVNLILSKIPFLHNHMHMCVLRKL